MIITRVGEHVSSSYPPLCAPMVILIVTIRAATEKMILTTSSEAAKSNHRTATRMHLEKNVLRMFTVRCGSESANELRSSGSRSMFVTRKIDGFQPQTSTRL